FWTIGGRGSRGRNSSICFKAGNDAPRQFATCALFPVFRPPGQNISWNAGCGDRSPLDLKVSFVSEQRTPSPVRNENLDSKAGVALVVPFTDIGYAGEDHGETELNRSFIEPLCAGSQPQSAVRGDAQIDIDRQVLMRAQIVNDALPLLAVNHVRVE